MHNVAPRDFPILTTDRLRLRAVTMEDVPAYRAVLAVPEVTRFSNMPDAADETLIEGYVRRIAGGFAAGTGCAWGIEPLRAPPALLGVIRFNWFNAEWMNGGIGYELHPDHWGQGLMSEAVHAVVTCGHTLFGLHRIEAWTLPGNHASDRVLLKAGFRLDGVLRQKIWYRDVFHDMRLFSRIAGDPLSA